MIDLKSLVSEEDLQRAAIECLHLLDYIALQTTVRYKRQKCEACGSVATPKGGYGASPGVPDLIITHHTWPRHMAMLAELKGPATKVSPDQKMYEAFGRYPIIRGDLRPLLDAIYAFEEANNLPTRINRGALQ